METRKINLTELEANRGQIEGLPSNPRQWTRSEISNLKRSIEQTPELFEARGLIVTPYDGKYIILGGNMRFEAAKALGLKDAPCIVIPEGTPAEKLKEIVIKDNGAFGAWDYDMLANEWDDLPLTDWGVPAWENPANEDEEGEEGASSRDLRIFVSVPLNFEEDVEDIKAAIAAVLGRWAGCKIA